MNGHLSAKQLNGHLHQTLNDAQRETLDTHLSSCPACRARLSEMNVLQQRVHRELTAELKAVKVPLSLTFEAIAPQLKQRRFLVFRRFAMRMTVGVTAIAVIIVLVMLVNNPQPAPTSTASVLAVNQAANFSTSGANTLADGWFLAGTAPQNYETGVDQVVTHDGKSSGYISSTVSSSEGLGTLMQMFKADEYRGKRLRLSAYVKTEHVKDWAGLWMRLDGPENEVLGFDNMQNRPIRGTVDWQPVVIILDVPQNSVDIAFGILLKGVGRVWIDNVQFEVVGQDVSTTQLKEDTTPPIPQPINLGFEAGLNGWTPESTSQDYVIDIDSTVVHSGQASGYIRSQQANPAGMAALSQYVKADEYRGKRVRITEYIKFDGASTAARFVVYAFGPHNTTLQSDSQPLYSTAKWQKRDTVLYVPENSDRIAYGVVLEGRGQVWIDNVSIETSPLQYTSFTASQPQDLDFEEVVTGWFLAGDQPQNYEVGADEAIVHTGKTSGFLKSKPVVTGTGFGTWMQYISADPYRGKRLRMSGYVKSANVEEWAGLWLRVDGPGNAMLSFDNMQNRPIQGNSDWQSYSIVLGVPEDSFGIGFGILLAGKGEVWLDDVKLEIVGQDVPTTNPYQQQPLNLSFENEEQNRAIHSE